MTEVTESEKIRREYKNNPKRKSESMSENLEPTATDNNTNSVTPEELAEVISEFEQYRQRLVEDMTTAAKKAKLPKSKVMARLEPELAKIDATLDNLRNQHAVMTSNN